MINEAVSGRKLQVDVPISGSHFSQYSSSNGDDDGATRRSGLPHNSALRVETYVKPRPYSGPSAEYVLQQRREHLSEGQYHFYKNPLMLVEAQHQYCFDEKGNAYIDAYANVAHIGHCHPTFTRQVAAASSQILSNSRYLHFSLVEYVRQLKSIMPSPELSVVFLVNSGSEANDLAMRIARCHTQRTKMAALLGSYHGTTMSCSGVSSSLSVGSEGGSTDFAYSSRDTVFLPVADPYRGRFRGDDPDCARKYVEWSREIIEEKRIQGDLAGVIVEAVQGVGGQIVYPPGYLVELFKCIRGMGGVCIVDEVQTGFGRVGDKHWWACELQGAVPDILTLGKPIGNGVPLGAVICTKTVAESFKGTKYFNTYGGNPLAMAAGLAVLQIIERDRLRENASRVGAELMRAFQELQRKHDIIGDVRGVGLFIGIELVRDRQTQEPATEETKFVMEEMRYQGVLIGTGGTLGNVLRLKPPLVFSMENAKTVAEALDAVLTELPRRFKRKAERELERNAAPSATYVFAGATNSCTRAPSRFTGSNHDVEQLTAFRAGNGHNNNNNHDSGFQRPLSPRRLPPLNGNRNNNELTDNYLDRNIYDALRSSREEKLFDFSNNNNNNSGNSGRSRSAGGGNNGTERSGSTLRSLVAQSLEDSERGARTAQFGSTLRRQNISPPRNSNSNSSNVNTGSSGVYRPSVQFNTPYLRENESGEAGSRRHRDEDRAFYNGNNDFRSPSAYN